MKAESLQGRKEREVPGRRDGNKGSEKGESGQGGNGGPAGGREIPQKETNKETGSAEGREEAPPGGSPPHFMELPQGH